MLDGAIRQVNEAPVPGLWDYELETNAFFVRPIRLVEVS